jgi:hypothetical protein
MFFESIWPEDDEGAQGFDEAGYGKAKAVCAGCPVRLQCYSEVMKDEGPSAQARRFGLRGGVTPQQRYSIWRRDALSCERCLETYDPLGLAAGEVVCSCGSFDEPAIPVSGDEWFPRHEGLLKRLTEYLLRETQPGDRILPPYRMLVALGHRRKDDLPLVYDRLIADGLILRGEGRGVYYRAAGHRALAAWIPPSRRHKEAA